MRFFMWKNVAIARERAWNTILLSRLSIAGLVFMTSNCVGVARWTHDMSSRYVRA
ncbi:hypothetical protein AN958_02616 [Leucoagaricus sp. SymC.cos]|nr:hypothetical protein AN958_02616 [Leucoagaricus sp. SymC.cos]